MVNGSRHTDRKSTRLNSSHLVISYAVFCLKKKKKKKNKKTSSIASKCLQHRSYLPARPFLLPFVSHRLPLSRLCYFSLLVFFFFFNDTATTEIYTLSLHDALPISVARVVNNLQIVSRKVVIAC